ncbi:MAG: hypothetical protein N2116_05555 [Armatimonadetes bacterium]|nr:hypothetical protein [Armatimonadota bacterium]
MRQFALMLALTVCSAAFGESPSETQPKALSSIRLFMLHPERKSSVPLSQLFSGHERIALNFVSARCQHSRIQLDSIEFASAGKRGGSLNKNFQSFAIVFVDRQVSEIEEALKGKSVRVRVFWDKGGKLAKALKVKVTPTIAILSRGYKLVGSYEGFSPRDPKSYREFFERLMKAVTRGTLLPPRPAQFPNGADSTCGPSG